MQLAARLAEMPVAEFIALNPGFSRPYIRASVTPRIVLPADKVDVFHDNLEALGEKSLVSWKTYHPKQGETFESIAKKHGMAVGQLKEVNGIPPRTKGVPRLLVVPTSATASTKMPIMYAPPIPVATRRIFHTVKKGETLASIAATAQGLGRGSEALERRQPGASPAARSRSRCAPHRRRSRASRARRPSPRSEQPRRNSRQA